MMIKNQNEYLRKFTEILTDYTELKRRPIEYTFFVKGEKKINKEIGYKNFISSIKNILSASKNSSIYFHYPFCMNKCKFCHYFRFNNTKKYLRYQIRVLLTKELKLFKKIFENEIRTISSVYIGGGTPSIMAQDEISEIMSALFEIYDLQRNAETSIEASIEGITEQKLEFYKRYFNRLSVGIQTFDTNILKSFNRFSNLDIIKDKIKLISTSSNSLKVNFDFIYGFPNQSLSSIYNDIDIIMDLFPNIESFTFYRLRLGTHERKGDLYNFYFNNNNLFPSQSEIYLMKFLISKKMRGLGFKEGPIGWFTKSGPSKCYTDRWLKRVPLIGFGLSTYSIMRKYQKSNFDDLEKNIKAIDNDKLPFESGIELFNSNNYDVAYRLKFDGSIPKNIESSIFKEKILQDERIFIEKKDSYKLTAIGNLFVEEILDSYLI